MMDDDLNRLAQDLGRMLMARGWHIGLAESCTGGLVGHVITNVAGSSSFLLGGIIAYANEVKRDVLGVGQDLLRDHGAVSEPVALAMARRARAVLSTEVGLSVTGIAGPSGGTPTKPVGTVFVALSCPLGDVVRHFLWNGDRLTNKVLSARAALALACEALAQGPSEAAAPKT